MPGIVQLDISDHLGDLRATMDKVRLVSREEAQRPARELQRSIKRAEQRALELDLQRERELRAHPVRVPGGVVGLLVDHYSGKCQTHT